MTIDPLVDQFISSLEARFKNGWAPYLFHYSDITNIVSILENGTLYSRNHCVENGLLAKDSAGGKVIDHTSSTYLDHVRLYFRPRTPPLYHIEGFCPNDNQGSIYDAHCPVPIYLVFDSRTILSDPQVSFSDGNLSGSSVLYSDKGDLDKLDFSLIYHNTWFNPDQKELIINRRCSEVIVPNKLQLQGALKYIACRSTAERETLLNLLSNEARERYKRIICLGIPLFFRERHFVRKVGLQKSEIVIDYNRSKMPSFVYTYVFLAESGERSHKRDKPVGRWYWDSPREGYTFSIQIDGHIAYLGNFKS